MHFQNMSSWCTCSGLKGSYHTRRVAFPGEIALIEIFCRIGCPETPSAPIGWPPLVRMDGIWTYEPIGLGGLAQIFPWARRPHDFPCFGQFQGTPESVYAESKLHHPIKMCGSRGSSVQCTSHATIVLLNINIWLCIHIFDYTYQWICGSDDGQMLACGSLQQ